MSYTPNIRQQGGKDYIFCAWRRQFVRLTPEEWVRQNFLHALVDQLGYPAEQIAVEALLGGSRRSRTDAVVYNRMLQPICLIEFKAPTVSLTQKVFDQVASYNRILGVKYFIISNGQQHIACLVSDNAYEILPELPTYEQING